jgi:hypothetical protein
MDNGDSALADEDRGPASARLARANDFAADPTDITATLSNEAGLVAAGHQVMF